MKCSELKEQLLDVAVGLPAEAPVEEHLRGCAACSDRLEEMKRTMALLDEWPAPEPSPYFDARLGARLREEASRPRSWWSFVRRPALAGAMAALLIVGGLLLRAPSDVAPQPQPGSAVADLQVLDKNHDLLANFDLLDDVQADQQQQEQQQVEER